MANLIEGSTSEVFETETELLTEANDDSEENFDSRVGRNTSVGVPSLLDKLKSPSVADLARKRKIKTPIGRKRCKGAGNLI